MSVSRRHFFTAVGAGAAALFVFPALDRRGELLALPARALRPVTAGLIRLDRNENPSGPFPSGRKAIEGALSDAGRYPYEAADRLREAIARTHGVGSEQVVLGCGSGEMLAVCTTLFTSAGRGLVVGQPTFEAPAAAASQLGRPVVQVPVTRTLQLDLDGMAAAARGAGLVYLCNPNNPTSTVHGAAAVKAFLARVRRESPETKVLVDEAYHEYVDDPAYATMVPEAREQNVIVARTFSKVFGMAGLRVGYAIASPDTAAAIEARTLNAGVNQFAAASAMVSIADQGAIRAEQARNRDVRAGVVRWFTSRGYSPAKCDANFVFVDIRRDVRPVIASCYDKGIAVGRPFPPLGTHLRVSIGLQGEMDKALAVLGEVLG